MSSEGGSQIRNVVLGEVRPDGEGEKTIERIRDLEPTETQEIRSASRLIEQVARARAFRRIQDLTALVLQRLELVEGRGKPATHEVQALVAGVRALVEARAQFIGYIEKLLGERAVLEAGAEDDETSSGETAWATLERLARRPDQKLRRDRNGVVGVLDASGQLVALGGTVRRAVYHAQLVFMVALTSVANDVAAAGRKLRLLHAEAPEGRPVILTDWPLASRGEKMQLTPEELQIEAIGEAMRLTRTAKAVLESQPAFPTKPETLEAAEELEPTDEGEADAGRGGDEATVDAADDHAGGDSSGGEPPGDRQATSGNARVQPPTPVDVAGLLSLASSLNDDLAKAWSDGLERAQTDAGIARQRAAVKGALEGVARHLRAERQSIAEFPPSLTRLAEFEVSEDLTGEALATAQIVAVKNVIKQLQPLTMPTTVQVEFGEDGPDALNRFWDSGAFAQLSDQLDLLGQLLAPEYTPDVAARAASFQHLRQAQAAWFSGDPQGCLMHAVAGLSAHLKTGLGALDARLAGEPALQDDGRADVVAAGVRLTRRIMDGEPLLAPAVLLAPVVSDLLADLCQPQPHERGLAADELFELFAEDLPFEILGDDEAAP